LKFQFISGARLIGFSDQFLDGRRGPEPAVTASAPLIPSRHEWKHIMNDASEQ
jgi:hypothetical protein